EHSGPFAMVVNESDTRPWGDVWSHAMRDTDPAERFTPRFAVSQFAVEPTKSRRKLSTSNQFRERIAAIDKIMRTAVQIDESCVAGVDAHVAVERGEHIAIMHRSILRVLPQPVRGSDHLSHPHAPTGEQAMRCLGPVVTAGILVDLGSAPKFAPHDDGDFL